MSANTHPNLTNKARRRQDAVYAAARNHSRRVAAMKIGLPLVAILGLGWLGAGLFLPSQLPGDLAVDIDLTSSVINNGSLVMANPEVTGITSDNRPYKLVADRATQPLTNAGAINMEGIRAEFEMEGGQKATLRAPSGSYDRDANTLVLDGRSVFITQDGVKFNFDGADIDVEKGNFVTAKPVEIDRNGTIITADSMQMADSGKRVIFQNNVKLTIPPGALTTVNAKPDANSQGTLPQTLLPVTQNQQ